MDDKLTFNNQEFYFGWKPNEAAVEEFLKTLPDPNFETAAPLLKDSGEGKDVFYWDIEEKVLGKRVPMWNQGSVGSCVSFGSGRTAQNLLLIQIALGNSNEAWEGNQVACEPIYGGSRCNVGGWYGSYEDGSLGSYAADWLRKWGIIPYGPNGLEGSYDTTRCREWGAKGVNEKYQEIAKKHPIKTMTQVTSANAARDALANGYPISICGSKGRTMQRRKNGFCPVEGTWYHCQALVGVCVVEDGTPAFVYCNSWGDYLGTTNNEVRLKSGKTVILPNGCYLSDYSSVESDLKQGDSFAYSSADGFIAQNISWLI